jgi:hypothetical protein
MPSLYIWHIKTRFPRDNWKLELAPKPSTIAHLRWKKSSMQIMQIIIVMRENWMTLRLSSAEIDYYYYYY